MLFRLSATRECTVVREVLGEYDGILITDFYAGYDSVPCRQQKCLVHLIRDLNNDVWRRLFDGELETFVLDVRNLLVPIMQAVNTYGLRKRNLAKFRTAVDGFDRQVIRSRTYRSDPVRMYQKRFQRYRHSLFRFLEYDGIPWNNNMGEPALRHLGTSPCSGRSRDPSTSLLRQLTYCSWDWPKPAGFEASPCSNSYSLARRTWTHSNPRDGAGAHPPAADGGRTSLAAYREPSPPRRRPHKEGPSRCKGSLCRRPHVEKQLPGSFARAAREVGVRGGSADRSRCACFRE